MHKNKYVYIVYLILPFFFFSCSQLGLRYDTKNPNLLKASSTTKKKKTSSKDSPPKLFAQDDTLIKAVRGNRFNEVEFILNFAQDLIDDPRKRPPELSKESILNSINNPDKDGYTILHYALDCDASICYQMLALLLECELVDIKAADCEGRTILHWAVSSGNLQVVDLILKFAESRFLSKNYLPQDHKDFINMKTKIAQDGSGGCSAIYWAISPISLPTDKPESSLEIFKLLLDISEINGTDNQGYTLGHWAVVQGRNDIFKLLIKYGADLSIQDKKGRTVFHLAIETIKDTMHSNLDLANHLIDQEDSILDQLVSLPPYRQEWDKKDHNGYSPLALLSDKLKLTLENIKDWKQEKNKKIQTNKRPHIESTEVENCLRLNKKKRGS
ncbi:MULTISPECIES: ankyrin repeat domain-containing protein [Candidatus Cardinium]|uniref:ankyrin repeat domain-containing protein n=1 Tax=Candidatus Cardinium TaxID=273135 RepID=UPI001FAA9ACD|nr:MULTISPECIES: ankyrin repeat domain-containing protein [Cardinium]